MQIAAHRRASTARRSILLAGLLLALPPGMPCAQSIHAYRDASGQWVFTDRGASKDGARGDALTVPRAAEAMRITVERTEVGAVTRLTAANDCLCVVSLRVAITQSDLPDIPRGARYAATLEPGARQVIVEARHDEKARPELQFTWSGALGSPDAAHQPPRRRGRNRGGR